MNTSRGPINSPDLNAAREELTSPDQRRRRRSAESFVAWYHEAGAVAARDALVERLADSHALTRVAACEAVLLQVPDHGHARETLQSLANHPNRAVTLRAIQAIGNLGAAACSVASTLIPYLSNEDTGLFRAAVQSLITIGANSEDVINSCLDVVQNPEFENRHSEVADAIVLAGRTASPLIIERLLFNGSSDYYLVNMLDKIHWVPMPAIDAVLNCVACKAIPYYERSRVFSWFDDPLPALQKGCEHPDRGVRNAVVEALQDLNQIGDPQKLSLLSRLVEDKDCCELIWLDSMLNMLVQSPEPSVALEAKHALDQWTNASQKTLRPLDRRFHEIKAALERDDLTESEARCMAMEIILTIENTKSIRPERPPRELLISLGKFVPIVLEAVRMWAHSGDDELEAWSASILPALEPEAPEVKAWLCQHEHHSYDDCTERAVYALGDGAAIYIDELLELMTHRGGEASAEALLKFAPDDPRIAKAVIHDACRGYLYEIKNRNFYHGPSLESLCSAWPHPLQLARSVLERNPLIAVRELEQIVDSPVGWENTKHINACRLLSERGYDRGKLVQLLGAMLPRTNFLWGPSSCAVLELLYSLGSDASPLVAELAALTIHDSPIGSNYAVQVLRAIGPKAIDSLPFVVDLLDRDDELDQDSNPVFDCSVTELRESVAEALVSVLGLSATTSDVLPRIVRNHYVRWRLSKALHSADPSNMADLLTVFCQRFIASPALVPVRNPC
ncbi:MAG: HEAT repeat domain-containing protein [Planctomycetaceae bacterium]